MGFRSAIKRVIIFRRVSIFFFVVISAYLNSFGQETNTNISGIVTSEKNEELQNATVVAVHEPTKNTYTTQTNSKGYFYLSNLRPGGPYSITISYTGFETGSKKDLYLSYFSHGDGIFEFTLKEKNNTLPEVTVHTKQNTEHKFGSETYINSSILRSLPSISRNFQDYARLIPQARINGDGMSLAGQSNKFNSFFIDGSNTNDMLGLSASGSAGGQTGTPPISIEAIEDFKVSQSPYDVQYGNFTGASINAITRSGSNYFEASAWYYFRNEQMAGRSPLPVEKPGSPGVFERPRLTNFFNQIAGAWTSGPFAKNKLFYFLLAETQSEKLPQPFMFSEYRGISSLSQINAMVDTVRQRHGYDPGAFLEIMNEVSAKRFVIKLDWNPDQKNKLTLSYRYNNAARVAPGSQNGPITIRFSNNRLRLISKINSGSLEWKRYFNGSANNRLLITYNNELTDRQVIGEPFPTVMITDGGATVTLGSIGTGQLNLFKASEFTLLNVYRFVKSNHAVSQGIDINFSTISDIAVANYFGQYTYRTMNDFLNNAFPNRYVRNASLVDKPVNDNTDAAAKFNTLRLGAFINDEIQVNKDLRFTFGVRIDGNSLPLDYKEDVFFNTVAKPEIEKYYDLEGAISGRTMRTHWQLSPRFGFNYNLPAQKITIRGGTGIFAGHILNLWASEFYFANMYGIDLASSQIQSLGLRLIANAYGQPDPQSLGLDPEAAKGKRVVVAENYKYPVVLRSSAGIDKKFTNNWTLATEIIFTKNIHEHRYKNITILPPARATPPPDSRNIYSLNTIPEKIPMPGSNPYSNIFLLTNNAGIKGYAYSFTVSVIKTFNHDLSITTAYTYGNSFSLFDPGSGGANNSDQWGQIETVNGKNSAKRSVSDFSLGHRVTSTLTKTFNYGKWSTLVTLFYNGQSGSPYSYVYDGTMINDNGRTPTAYFDLIYIPTETELNNMTFITNSAGNSPDQQKQMLNDFIENDKYLQKHRGEFAERNRSRLPFTHVVDLRIQQDLKIKTRKKEVQISIIYDVFNVTNMLNKNWGRIYLLSGDNHRLIRFAGFANTTTLTPQYQFTSLAGRPWSIQSSTAPGNSPRWISQLGVRVNFK